MKSPVCPREVGVSHEPNHTDPHSVSKTLYHPTEDRMKIAIVLLALLFSQVSYAARIPFSQEADDRFSTIEADSWVTAARIAAGAVTESKLLPMAGSTSSLNVKRTAHLIWDPTTTTTHRTGTAVAFGTGFGATIPANSLITQVYYYTKTAVVSTGNNGTIAFNCLSAGDLQVAVDPDGTWGLANGMGSGTITGIPVAGVSLVGLVVAAGCTPTLTVATNNFTGGRVHIYIDYVTFD